MRKMILAGLGFLFFVGASSLSGFAPPSTAQGPFFRTVTPKAFIPGDVPHPVPLTPLPGGMSNHPAEGPVMVIVQLDTEPLAAVGEQAIQAGLPLPEVLAQMRDQRARVQDQQRQLIEILTASPYNARLIGTTFITSNTVIIEVDASLIDQIRGLPGVTGVRPDRIGQLDSLPQAPVRPPGFGPRLN